MHTVIIAVAVASGLAAAGAAMTSPQGQAETNVLRTSVSCPAGRTSGYPSSMQPPADCAAIYGPSLDVALPDANQR